MWIWKPGGMGDSSDDEARVSAVDPGQASSRLTGVRGDAGGRRSIRRSLRWRGAAGVQGGDGGFPVGGGEQGDAVATLVPAVMNLR